jgi:ubiquinone/menaquinone biosynthesis C-methylase UbiE
MEDFPTLLPNGNLAAVQDFFGVSETEARDAPAAQGPHNPHEFAQRLYAFEALSPAASMRASARRKALAQPEPYSLQWFLNIESQRHSKHGRWIPRLLEFAKHAGENLLGLGHGLGTDWAQYARNGARVIVCSPAGSQLELVRRNFELRGLQGRFVNAHPAKLPLESASIDVACISSLFHGIDDPKGVVEEVYRVLKPGGKVLTVTPARYDVDFWFHCCFPWYRWFRKDPREGNVKASGRFTARELKKLFGRFIEHRIHKRQLRRSEVPHVWRWLPLSFLACLMGRMLILKAFKPLSVGKTGTN